LQGNSLDNVLDRSLDHFLDRSLDNFLDNSLALGLLPLPLLEICAGGRSLRALINLNGSFLIGTDRQVLDPNMTQAIRASLSLSIDAKCQPRQLMPTSWTCWSGFDDSFPLTSGLTLSPAHPLVAC
jgi:hypothetical protein